jgi:hypothetical protein
MPKMPSHLDARHVWLCPDPAAQRIRNAGINSLAQWMHSSLTSPDIQLVVTTRLGQLFSNLPFTPIPSLADDAQAALLIQDSIGWANFFEGCIAQEWEAIQEAYFHWCRSRKTGCRWTASLIQKLWDLSWDLWEHRIGTNVQALPHHAAYLLDHLRWHGASVPFSTPPWMLCYSIISAFRRLLSYHSSFRQLSKGH